MTRSSRGGHPSQAASAFASRAGHSRKRCAAALDWLAEDRPQLVAPRHAMAPFCVDFSDLGEQFLTSDPVSQAEGPRYV